MSEEINFDDIEFGEPIEEREPTYREGYIRGIYRARNIIDSKQKEIERLNNIINELEKDMIFDMNDYEKDLDIQTGNIYSEYHRGYCQNGKDYYDKLQELKGVDKE